MPDTLPEFKQFISTCSSLLKGEGPQFLGLIRKRYDNCPEAFRNSSDMVHLLSSTTSKMLSDKQRCFVHLKDFITELKAWSSQSKGPPGQKRKAGTLLEGVAKVARMEDSTSEGSDLEGKLHRALGARGRMHTTSSSSEAVLHQTSSSNQSPVTRNPTDTEADPSSSVAASPDPVAASSNAEDPCSEASLCSARSSPKEGSVSSVGAGGRGAVSFVEDDSNSVSNIPSQAADLSRSQSPSGPWVSTSSHQGSPLSQWSGGDGEEEVCMECPASQTVHNNEVTRTAGRKVNSNPECLTADRKSAHSASRTDSGKLRVTPVPVSSNPSQGTGPSHGLSDSAAAGFPPQGRSLGDAISRLKDRLAAHHSPTPALPPSPRNMNGEANDDDDDDHNRKASKDNGVHRQHSDKRRKSNTVVRRSPEPSTSGGGSKGGHYRTSPREEEERVEGSKKESKNVRRLEKLLEKIRDEIEKVREKDLTLDELDADDSAYIYEDRLQKKFMKVWDRLCQLKGRSTSSGRPIERRFKYEGTRFPEINRKIEKFVNRPNTFPDYHDIRGIIKKVNTRCHLGLNVMQINSISKETFMDVGEALQQRRKADFVSTFHSKQTMPYCQEQDPAFFDEELRLKLEENHRVGNSRLEGVIRKYTDLQLSIGDMDKDEVEREASAVYHSYKSRPQHNSKAISDSRAKSASHTHSKSPSHTHSKSPSHTHSKSPSHTHSKSPSYTHSKSPSHTHSKSPSHTHSKSPSYIHSKSPSHSHSKSPSHTHSKSPSHTHSKSPSHTHSKSPSHTHSKSPSCSKSPSYIQAKSPSHIHSKDTLYTHSRPSHTHSTSPSHTHSTSPSHAHSTSPSHARSTSPLHAHSTSPSHAHSTSPSHAHSKPSSHAHSKASMYTHSESSQTQAVPPSHTHSKSSSHTHPTAPSCVHSKPHPVPHPQTVSEQQSKSPSEQCFTPVSHHQSDSLSEMGSKSPSLHQSMSLSDCPSESLSQRQPVSPPSECRSQSPPHHQAKSSTDCQIRASSGHHSRSPSDHHLKSPSDCRSKSPSDCQFVSVSDHPSKLVPEHSSECNFNPTHDLEDDDELYDDTEGQSRPRMLKRAKIMVLDCVEDPEDREDEGGLLDMDPGDDDGLNMIEMDIAEEWHLLKGDDSHDAAEWMQEQGDTTDWQHEFGPNWQQDSSANTIPLQQDCQESSWPGESANSSRWLSGCGQSSVPVHDSVQDNGDVENDAEMLEEHGRHRSKSATERGEVGVKLSRLPEGNSQPLPAPVKDKAWKVSHNNHHAQRSAEGSDVTGWTEKTGENNTVWIEVSEDMDDEPENPPTPHTTTCVPMPTCVVVGDVVIEEVADSAVTDDDEPHVAMEGGHGEGGGRTDSIHSSQQDGTVGPGMLEAYEEVQSSRVNSAVKMGDADIDRGVAESAASTTEPGRSTVCLDRDKAACNQNDVISIDVDAGVPNQSNDCVSDRNEVVVDERGEGGGAVQVNQVDSATEQVREEGGGGDKDSVAAEDGHITSHAVSHDPRKPPRPVIREHIAGRHSRPASPSAVSRLRVGKLHVSKKSSSPVKVNPELRLPKCLQQRNNDDDATAIPKGEGVFYPTRTPSCTYSQQNGDSITIGSSDEETEIRAEAKDTPSTSPDSVVTAKPDDGDVIVLSDDD